MSPRPKQDPEARPTTVAERRFAEQAAALSGLSLEERFARIYQTNLWSDAESRSGAGSSLDATASLRVALPPLLRSVNARRLLDVPCGDFNWMSQVDLSAIDYIGGDIVESIIEANRQRYESPGRVFMRVDLTSGPLPDADVILCRDCLVHFSFDNIIAAFRTIKASGAQYLLTTTFLDRQVNKDIVDGDWRPLNLVQPPFLLPPPHNVILEDCMEEGGAYADKALAVWRVSDLPTQLAGQHARTTRSEPTPNSGPR
ncbi:MAG TPA: class I SAM-dependent methyltransferase [Gemmatimonadaceae bacterium]|nr:class I SAM-dependent methyltransferase [Gemmatimonadaceae bacterium]